MNTIRLAGCVIVDEAGRLLLMHRNTPKRVQWELPGGKIEDGEIAEVAAEREIAEELGVRVAIVKKLGEHSFQEDGYEMDYLWFLATIESGKPVLQEAKFDALRFFTWEELRNEPALSANARNLVAAYFRQELAV